MDTWLIRTSKNQIAGPYGADQGRELIRTGQLQLQDEICRANHYWIALMKRDPIMIVSANFILKLELSRTNQFTLLVSPVGAGDLIFGCSYQPRIHSVPSKNTE